ncbi:hypothetical protein HAT2_00687 [Candidatus Similichlamydia laticola]|uniref:Uncharacterized protein n=1 Tax=Candidatus Similichlamydia laticola TaxID=2170265 RepID=A0A369KE78_9BACT|nr:hypothetical protein HAT2_00687 [Candidatus Similichlamydia laticola]
MHRHDFSMGMPRLANLLSIDRGLDPAPLSSFRSLSQENLMSFRLFHAHRKPIASRHFGWRRTSREHDGVSFVLFHTLACLRFDRS